MDFDLGGGGENGWWGGGPQGGWGYLPCYIGGGTKGAGEGVGLASYIVKKGPGANRFALC
jgi:hypothetical protein